jgi:hypothetical protein
VRVFFIVFGVVLVIAGLVTLLFSRQLNEALMRRRPPPAANRAEALRLFRLRSASTLVGGLISLFIGLARAAQ